MYHSNSNSQIEVDLNSICFDYEEKFCRHNACSNFKYIHILSLLGCEGGNFSNYARREFPPPLIQLVFPSKFSGFKLEDSMSLK